jgi:hypothetical protein
MKKSLLAAVFAGAAALTGCDVGVSASYYDPYCYYQYDPWYGYDVYVCDSYYYYGNGTQEVSRDIIEDVARKDEILVEKAGAFYAKKFQLGAEEGMKMAKIVRDFNLIQDRSAKDVEAFAEKLYGVNSNKLMEAVSSAQAGNNQKLDGVLGEAAVNFGTSKENMKEIVKTLHGNLLKQNGISL